MAGSWPLASSYRFLQRSLGAAGRAQLPAIGRNIPCMGRSSDWENRPVGQDSVAMDHIYTHTTGIHRPLSGQRGFGKASANGTGSTWPGRGCRPRPGRPVERSRVRSGTVSMSARLTAPLWKWVCGPTSGHTCERALSFVAPVAFAGCKSHSAVITRYWTGARSVSAAGGYGLTGPLGGPHITCSIRQVSVGS